MLTKGAEQVNLTLHIKLPGATSVTRVPFVLPPLQREVAVIFNPFVVVPDITILVFALQEFTFGSPAIPTVSEGVMVAPAGIIALLKVNPNCCEDNSKYVVPVFWI
jgi:hypothetical protein